EVEKIKEGSSAKGSKLITSRGSVTANTTSVIAGEAYVSQLKQFKRRVMPVYSLVTLTEPLTEQQWNEIGWKNRETIGSTRNSINYLQRTIDGRILFGGRGQPYRMGSKIKDSFDVHGPTHRTLQQMLREWFPPLSNVHFTHSWGGVVGITRDWTPNFHFDKQYGIANAWGYVGQGVSTTNLAGRTLRNLILEKESSLTKLPPAQHKSKKWEIEPFRFLGARFVQASLEH